MGNILLGTAPLYPPAVYLTYHCMRPDLPGLHTLYLDTASDQRLEVRMTKAVVMSECSFPTSIPTALVHVYTTTRS